MKRVGNLYLKIAEPQNLRLAFVKAAKGKQARTEVVEYRERLEENLALLRNQLLEGRVELGCYRFFYVHDPKKRLICAASFAERVLHHAVMNLCEPVFEAYSIDDSFACRRGKGQQRAINRAQQFARRYPWYLKLDIARYFDSIDHDVVEGLLQRRFKDNSLLQLFSQILNSYAATPGKGLPIGNLISQHLANNYLGFFDHWVKQERRVKGYVRSASIAAAAGTITRGTCARPIATTTAQAIATTTLVSGLFFPSSPGWRRLTR